MGVNADLLAVLGRMARCHRLGGQLATLGVQEVSVSEPQIASILDDVGLPPRSGDIFRRLGFESVETLDVSAYEGCDHIVDLNAPLDPQFFERYDVVFDGGTLEHVFDVRNGLRSIFDMLKYDGVVVHVSPSDGWMDHGFYQFSPTFFLDYYRAAGFELLDIFLLRRSSDEALTILEGYSGTAAPAGSGRILVVAAARKRAGALREVVPTQGYYSNLFAGDETTPLRYRPPERLIDGLRNYPPYVERALERIETSDGFSLVVDIAAFEAAADRDGAPSASGLQLWEDDHPLGPPHALHEAIRKKGGGQYSHWGQQLIFSTSDNRPPGDRRYVVRLPLAG